MDRCVCHRVRFAELLRRQRQCGATFDELQRQTGCGTGCGMCVPYIRISLRTGEDRLPVMNDNELQERGGM